MIRYHRTFSGAIFDAANVLILVVVAALMLFPFFYVFVVSFASFLQFLKSNLVLWPNPWSLIAYRYIFSSHIFISSIYISVYITVLGSLINLAFTTLMAYALTRSFLGQRVILIMVIITLFFSGGLIPTYLVVKATHLINTLWALMIPGAISSFNLIVMRQFFQSLPTELTESARMDGANDLRIFWSIILPLSKPALAAFGLFYAVGHWNSYFDGILYLNNSALWPIQVRLREIVLLQSPNALQVTAQAFGNPVPPETVQMAAIIVATLPILVVYPFLQKHFTKGVLVGSIKA